LKRFYFEIKLPLKAVSFLRGDWRALLNSLLPKDHFAFEGLAKNQP